MSWWQYLLLVNLYLVLFYAFFYVLLRRETFFQLNRIYIVASACLSFLIPLIQSEWVKSLFITQRVKFMLYSHPLIIYSLRPSSDEQPVTIGQMLLIAYLIIAVVLLIRFVLQLIVLKKILNDPASAPFSFFKAIRLSEDLKSRDIIEAHEQVHAKQWHSADVLWIELLAIINWFNPVVYLYRKSIKRIHEFIADQQAINNGMDKSEYALLLLSQTFNLPAHQLANPFFTRSLLKERITMLQKRKSPWMALVKYGLSAPLFILMLVLSSATINNSKAFRIINRNAEQVFATPATHNLTTGIDSGASAADVTLQMPVVSSSPADSSINTANAWDKNYPNLVADTVPAKKDNQVFTSVELSPDFPGGIEAFYHFLSKTIRYPAEMRKNKIEGRVIVTFVIEKNGSLSNIVVLRSPGYGSAEESARVMALSPKWKPGIQNGRTVRVQYTLPINFSLAGTDAKKDTLPKNGSLNPIKDHQATDHDSSKTTVQPSRFGITLTAVNDGVNNASALNNVTGKPIPPLYILDGKEMPNFNLSSLNPKDIESISVLKDKSAGALYGNKGAHGVVVITTKKLTHIQLKN